MIYVAVEVAHYSALLPMVALLALRPTRPSVYWAVALGFLVSFFGDSLQAATHGSWDWWSIGVGVQMALFVVGLTGIDVRLLVVTGFMAGTGALAVFGGGEPDVWVTTMGSVAVCWLARGATLAPALMTYCGLGTVLYLLYAASLDDYGRATALWYGYQGARLTAFSLFIHAARRAT